MNVCGNDENDYTAWINDKRRNLSVLDTKWIRVLNFYVTYTYISFPKVTDYNDCLVYVSERNYENKYY